MYCDNKSTICLSNNPEYHKITKHIDVRYNKSNFIRDLIEDKIIRIEHIST